PKQTGDFRSPSRKPTSTSAPGGGTGAAPSAGPRRHTRAHTGSGETAGTFTRIRPKLSGSAVLCTMPRCSCAAPAEAANPALDVGTPSIGASPEPASWTKTPGATNFGIGKPPLRP